MKFCYIFCVGESFSGSKLKNSPFVTILSLGIGSGTVRRVLVKEEEEGFCL